LGWRNCKTRKCTTWDFTISRDLKHKFFGRS
jgi:hypothetical protein